MCNPPKPILFSKRPPKKFSKNTQNPLDRRHICVYNLDSMRRKSGAFVPLELAIIHAAKHLREEGIEEFYGFQITKRLEEEDNDHHVVGYGTLYRALARLQKRGILQSRWEQLPPGENRPRRRYYRLIEDKPKKGKVP